MNSIYEKFENEISFDQARFAELVQLGKDLNEDVVTQLLEIHFEVSESSLHEIQEFSRQQDFLNMSKTAHKLKSSCGTLGLIRLHRLCHHLENNVCHQNVGFNEVVECINEIIYEYQKTKSEIQIFYKTGVVA